MTIRFTAKGLYVNGELMKDFHSPHNIAKHIKAILFGSN